MQDRERQSSFSLSVLANNSFSSIPLTGMAVVRINVSDANDEYPQFQEAEYFITLSESALPNTHVVDINATDGDQPGVCDGLLLDIYSYIYASVNGAVFL